MTLNTSHVSVARVEHVNKDNRTVTVSLMSDEGSIIPDVQILSNYAHTDDGSGNVTLPEVGAVCQIMYSNDRYPPVILGYLTPLAPGEGFTGGLPEMDEGDQVITAGSQGYIILRRCGVLEIGATPLSSLTFIPVENLIRMLFGNLEIIGGLGNITWKGDETAGVLRIGVATASGGTEEVILQAGNVEYGAHSGPSNVLGPADMRLELIVSPDGGSTVVAGVHISAEGNTSFESSKNVGYMIQGSWEIEVDKYLSLVSKEAVKVKAQQEISLDAVGNINIDGREVHMTALGMPVLDGTAASVSLAGGTTPVALASGVIAVAEAIARAITTIDPVMGVEVEAAVAAAIVGVAATKVKAQ